MKKILFLLSTVLVVSFVGCGKDSGKEGGETPGGKTEIVEKTISVTLPATKVALSGTKINWEANETVSVFDGSSNNKFTMVSGSAQGSTANFAGKVKDNADEYVALFPYSASSSYSSGKVSGTISAYQTFDADGFDYEDFAAAGRVQDDAVALNSLVAFVKVTLGSGQTAGNISLSGNKNEAVAGNYTAVVSSDGTIGTVTPGEGAAQTIVCRGEFLGGYSYLLTTFANATFSSGITVSIDLGEGKIATKTISESVSTASGKVYEVNMADAEISEIKVNYLLESDTLTFNLGETKEIEIESVNVATVDFDPFGPSGWQTDASNAASGKVKITAPAALDGIDAAANMKILGTSISGTTVSDEIIVRLAGINNKEDLIAARDAVVSKEEGAIDPYLVDGWLTLNADISITDEDMITKGANRYFFPVLTTPINGQNKTITINSVYDASAVSATPYYGFIQWIKADIKDLKLTGSMEFQNLPKREARVGALAGLIGDTGNEKITINISNVENSVNFTVTAPTAGNNGRIGGFFGMVAGGAGEPEINIKDCTYSGTLTTNENVREFAGFIGLLGSGSPGSITTLTNCKFTGKIDYSQTVLHGTLRIAGLVGSSERSTTFINCESSGEINVNAGGAELVKDTGGLAGITGRTNAGVAGVNTTYELTGCTVTSAIKVTNAKNGGSDANYIAQLIGTIKSTENVTLADNKENGSISITYAE